MTQTKKVVAKPKTKAVAKPKKEELMWLGGQKLLGTPITEKDKRERATIELVARVLNVSVFGVNILGGNIYLNKLGLGQKAHQYYPNVRFKYEWVQMAKDDKEKAICQCKVQDNKGQDLSDWVLGECSPPTMKMGTLAGYQNHMAQTRAKNRAILEVFGVRIHEEMLIEVDLLRRRAKGEIETTPSGLKLEVGNVSAEELNGLSDMEKRTTARLKENKIANLKAGKAEMEQIKMAAKNLGIRTDAGGDMQAGIEFALKEKVDLKNLSKTQASELLFKLLAKGDSK